MVFAMEARGIGSPGARAGDGMDVSHLWLGAGDPVKKTLNQVD